MQSKWRLWVWATSCLTKQNNNQYAEFMNRPWKQLVKITKWIHSTQKYPFVRLCFGCIKTYRTPIKTYGKPINTYRKCIKTYRKPIKAYRKPIKTYRKPIKTYRKPINTYRKPIKTYRKPTPPRSSFKRGMQVFEVAAKAGFRRFSIGADSFL